MSDDEYDKIWCPICHSAQQLLHEQHVDGIPTGKRFIAHHPMRIWFEQQPSKTVSVGCPLGGKIVDES